MIELLALLFLSLAVICHNVMEAIIFYSSKRIALSCDFGFYNIFPYNNFWQTTTEPCNNDAYHWFEKGQWLFVLCFGVTCMFIELPQTFPMVVLYVSMTLVTIFGVHELFLHKIFKREVK